MSKKPSHVERLREENRKRFDRMEIELARDYYPDYVAIGKDGVVASAKTKKALDKLIVHRTDYDTLFVGQVTTFPEVQLGGPAFIITEKARGKTR